MAPAALPYVYCTEADLQAYISVDGETGRVDDNSDGAIEGVEQTYVTQAINWATARCNLYLLKAYTAADLATDWMTNYWCIILACYWLSCRRGNPSPGSVDALYKESLEEMEKVRAGDFALDLGTRFSLFPAWSNTRIELFNRLRKVVVERPISDAGSSGTAAQQPAATRDVTADYLFDWK